MHSLADKHLARVGGEANLFMQAVRTIWNDVQEQNGSCRTDELEYEAVVHYVMHVRSEPLVTNAHLVTDLNQLEDMAAAIRRMPCEVTVAKRFTVLWIRRHVGLLCYGTAATKVSIPKYASFSRFCFDGPDANVWTGRVPFSTFLPEPVDLPIAADWHEERGELETAADCRELYEYM